MNPNKFCKAGKVECKWFKIIIGFKSRLPICEQLHWQVEDFERCPIPNKIEAPEGTQGD